MTTPTEPLPFLALVDDLMFTVKIQEGAKQIGRKVRFMKDHGRLLEAVLLETPAVILDLNRQQLDPIGLIAAMKEQERTRDIPLLGFVSHVDSATISAAREAGCDKVVARSEISARTAETLRSVMRGGQ